MHFGLIVLHNDHRNVSATSGQWFKILFFILVLTTLKKAIWVAETCLWSLCNKIIFINPSALVIFNKILYLQFPSK